MINVERWAQIGAGFGGLYAVFAMMLLGATGESSGFSLAGVALGGAFGALSAMVGKKLGAGFGTLVMLGFVIGAISALVITPSTMPYDEHMVRGGILGAAWWVIALVAAFVAAGVRRVFRVGTRLVHSGVSSRDTDGIGPRLDEIEALFAAGKITDTERAEARARLLVRGR